VCNKLLKFPRERAEKAMAAEGPPMNWKELIDLMIAGFGNALALGLTIALAGGLALKLMALAQPRVERQKGSRPTGNTRPR